MHQDLSVQQESCFKDEVFLCHSPIFFKFSRNHTGWYHGYGGEHFLCTWVLQLLNDLDLSRRRQKVGLLISMHMWNICQLLRGVSNIYLASAGISAGPSEHCDLSTIADDTILKRQFSRLPGKNNNSEPKQNILLVVWNPSSLQGRCASSICEGWDECIMYHLRL